MNKKNFLFFFLPIFYFLLFFNLNNKTLLLILLISVLILFKKFKNLKLTLWLLYLLILPFEKGKGFSFNLLPFYMTYQKLPYNFWFTVTFADLLFFFLVYLLIRKEIVSRWRTKSLKVKKKELFLLFFLLISFLTIYFSQFRFVSFLAFIRLMRMIFAYFMIQKILTDRNLIRPTVLALASSLIFQGGWAVLQFLRQGPLGKDLEHLGEFFSPFGHLTVEEPVIFRASGTFVHPNALASFIGILLSFVFVFLFNRNLKISEKRFLGLAFLSGGLGLLFTASRAAWVIIFLILILTIVYLYQKNKLKSFAYLKNWFLRFLLVGIVFLPFLILPRMVSLYQSFEKYGGAYYRVDLIKKAALLSLRYPLGIGLEVFPAVMVYEFGKYFSYPAPVHNLFLQVLVALGIPGLMFFLIFLLLSYKQFFLNIKKEKLFFLKTAAFFATLAFLGLGSFYPLFLRTNISEYFWLFLGILSL